LKMQLNPHFLFNSLHAVAALIGDAPEAAERLVVRLSELLRQAMRSVGTQEVPLEEEMETLRPFVEIEAERLGGRLAVEWDVEEEALDALVPHMVLQPLVENAVKHGLEPRAGGGRLRIAARREGEWLVVEVEDDGVGLETAAGRRTHGAGVGSENLRARLEQLYGGAASFTLESRVCGTVARLRLPLHQSSAQLRPVPPPMRGGGSSPASPSPVRTVAVDGGYSPAIGWVGRVAAAAWLAGMWANGFGVRNGLRTEGGHVVTAAQALVCAGINAALWTLLGVAAFVATRRRPFSAASWRGSLRVHAAVGLGLAAVIAAGRAVCHAWVGYPPGRWSAGAEAFGITVFLAMYLVLVGLAHAVEYAQRDRQKQVAELRLQASLSRAELERTSAELRMLKMQLNPHFLFNSLHAVAALIGDAPEAAERLVVRLSELLRQAMRSVGTQEVPLEEEMETLRPFVEIEAERLGGRLAVEWDVEEEALDALVPHMVLQPLVENAVKHGLEPLAGGGRLRIAARREGVWLVVEVEDDGVGLETAAGRRTHGAGVGSENLRARLDQLYGAAASFALAPRAGGGSVAGMRIPWHLEAAPPTGARAVEPERAERR
ncbi:MAG TPA: histidine kinase, partial [Longimicrobiaceae bacterium]|nr:histidine kinase [Longimicrobiaceae bacterium]